MELSHTAYVILGMLSWGPKSGYAIKALVDDSTRFFWAASYGQIYPELRRLAEAGLIEGTEMAQGGRKRTEYALTGAGSRRLREWLESDPEVFELRDEGLLKLFFASAAPQSAGRTLAAKRRGHLETVDRFREIEASGMPEGYALMVLRYGIEMNEWMADWCERAERALATTEGGPDV
jgi:PadR family transcriptional regulator AphA